MSDETSEDTIQPVSDAPAEDAAIIVDEATDEVLRVHLDQFEGPMEVLLYLIKVQEIDILDIPIVTITEQYLSFLELMRDESLEITGDYLVMAATLIQIKSKMLLPDDQAVDEDEEFEEEDPRLELVEKLLEYRLYRDVTEKLDFLMAERQRWFTRKAKVVVEAADDEEEMLEVSLQDLTEAFRGVLRYFTDDLFHTVEGEAHSIDEKVEFLENKLNRDGSIAWSDVWKNCSSRLEVVVSFLAILELCRMRRVKAQQSNLFEEIRLFLVDDDSVSLPEPDVAVS
jgi:segregation and condensation protein A